MGREKAKAVKSVSIKNILENFAMTRDMGLEFYSLKEELM